MSRDVSTRERVGALPGDLQGTEPEGCLESFISEIVDALRRIGTTSRPNPPIHGEQVQQDSPRDPLQNLGGVTRSLSYTN